MLDYETARKKALLFGLFGADRRYLGDKNLANGKLILTCLSLGLYTIPWWAIDYFIIKSHESDWDNYVAKRKAVQAKKQRAIELTAEQKALVEERKKTGKCVKCGSDKLQAVAETYSRAQMSDALANIIPRGNTSLEQKVQSKTLLVCLNCGHKRAV